MQRGEKRGLDDTASASAATSGPPAHKKAREKMPDFDWSTDNFRMTWALVEELKRPENKSVLFPDQENLPIKSGDTKEDAYRRIARVVCPDAYNHDAQTSGSRMKNKTVAMWKEYSGYCRKLAELCTAHHVVLPNAGPDESHPQEIQSEWRRINNSMPVFQTLRTFMPVRQDDSKAKAPSKMQLVSRGSSSILANLFDDDIDQDESQQSRSHREPRLSPSSGGVGPAQSSPAARTPTVRDLTAGAAEGRQQANGRDHHHSPTMCLRTSEYLDLRRSYQEDVRLGIFTPAEAKAHIERLDSQFKRSDSFVPRSPVLQLKSDRERGQLPPPPSSSFSGSTPVQTPSITFSPLYDSQSEHLFTERVRQLGFTKPTQLPALTRLPAKEFFKVLIDHASVCPLEECRLDPGRKLPHLGISYNPQTYDPVDVYIASRSGPTPLMHHPSAACGMFISSVSARNNIVNIMDIQLGVHPQASWHTTLWDFTQMVITNAMRTALTPDDMRNIQMKVHSMSADPALRQRFQGLKDTSTLFDIMRIGYLYGHEWLLPTGSVQDGVRERQPVHH